MSFTIQSGDGLNLLARAAAVKAPTSGLTIDSDHPLANLYDGRPSQYARAVSVLSGTWIEFDMNLVPNGDGEGADYSDWSVVDSGGGTPTLTQTLFSPLYAGSGSNRLQMTGGTGGSTTTATYEFKMRAGEKAQIYSAGLIEVGTATTFEFFNRETGEYLTSGGAWSTTQQNFRTYSTGLFVDDTTQFEMPDVGAGGGLWQRVRLRVSVSTGATLDGRFEVKIVPGWNLFSVFGHMNTPIANRLEFEYQALSGDDPLDAWSTGTAAGALEKTTVGNALFPDAELYQPTIWNLNSVTRYERWVRFDVGSATATEVFRIGELILAQAETIPSQPRWGIQLDEDMSGQIRHETGAGDEWVYNRTPWRRRRITMTFDTKSPEATGDDSAYRALSNALVDRTAGGEHSVLLIPREHDPRLVIFGAVSASRTWSHMPPSRTTQVDIREYPIPGLHHTLTE